MNSSASARPTALRAAVALVTIALAGCGPGPAAGSPSAAPSTGVTPSPAPTTTATSSVAPSGSPVAVTWQWQQAVASLTDGAGVAAIGPDGTVYVSEKGAACGLALHAFDSAGRERSGWPYCLTGGSCADFAAVDGGGTVYLQAAYPGGIAGIGPDGTVGAGWPQDYGYLVGILDAGIVVGTPSENGISELRAYDPEGRGIPGWPVTVPGEIHGAGDAHVAPDGSVAVVYLDPSIGRRLVTVIEPDGSARAGWPVRVPAKMDGVSTQLESLTSDGRIVLSAHEPWPDTFSAAVEHVLPSQIAVFTPEGTIPAGWPVRFDRPLSVISEGPDGVLYAVAGDVVYSYRGQPPKETWAGGPYDVIALQRDGSPVPGWPVRLPDGMTPQRADSAGQAVPWAQPPVVGDAGRVVVTTGRGAEERDGVVLLGPGGSIDGIFRLPKGREISRGGWGTPGPPALAPVLGRGRVFLVISPGMGKADELWALDSTGTAVPGWPLTVEGGGPMGLFSAPGGTLVVTTVREDPVTFDHTLLVLTADPSATDAGG